MIKSFKKINNLGIFSDFAWDPNVPEFKKYNLIYGSNGSGKTTLSRLFAALESGSMSDHAEMQYEVDTDSGTLKTGQKLSVPLKVFNREYVKNNVYTPSGRARPILILGEENKRAAEAIEADEALVQKMEQKLGHLNEAQANLGKQRNKTFTDIARTISQNTSGLATRTYRKPDAERAFLALSTKALLDDATLALRSTELNQKEEPDVSEILHTLPGHDVPLDRVLSRLHDEATALCAQTVESRVVSRLKEHHDLAKWVEQGTSLHETHKSQHCEFCGQPLPQIRMKQLADHFNDADRKLKVDIENMLARLAIVKNAIDAIRPPDKANLYDELRDSYDAAAMKLGDARDALLINMESFANAIQEKATRTTEPMALDVYPDGAAVLAAIEATNAEIKKHNAKTREFNDRKVKARNEIEIHYLSTIFDDVKDIDKQTAILANNINSITNVNVGDPNDLSIAALKKRIASNKAKISSSHKGCYAINEALRTFLGRNELQFDVESDGYVLKRGNTMVAKTLSEGERTAIGVAHFIVTLKEHGFEPAKGIVVVDDPISSLDSNSIFQAFAFLKTAVKDCKQVFFLTHNFDFLRLLLNWMQYEKGKNYYMITSIYKEDTRVAAIRKLDKLLCDYKTEYQYLFKRLYTFAHTSESHDSIELTYDIPNIARKVLDSFLMFYIPSNDTPHDKLKALNFDKVKLEAIYRFTNARSHETGKGFDPSLVAETAKNVEYLLEMINEVFPEHYQVLVQSIEKDTPQGTGSGGS